MDSLNLNNASDIIIDIFDVNEYQSSLNSISFLYKNLEISIWYDKGLHSIILALPSSQKGFFLSILSKLLQSHIVDTAFHLVDLKNSLRYLRDEAPQVSSLLKDPRIDDLYLDKSGAKPLDLNLNQ